jgi:hypothetical protein
MLKRSAVLLTIALLGAAPSLPAGEADKYLPADSAILLRLDVKGLLASPALKDDKDALDRAKKLIDTLLAGYDGVRKHMNAAGIDVYRDVATLTTAAPGDGDFDKGFVVLEGTFDPAKFKKAAEDAAAKQGEGVKLLKVGPHDVVSIALPGRDEPLYACLVDKNTLVGAGTKDKLAAALKQDAVAKDVKPLQALLDAKQHLTFAGTRPSMVKLLEKTNLPFGDVLGPILEGAETVSGGVTYGKECEFVMRFGAKDEKAAKQFFQQTTIVLAAARGLVAKKAKEDPDYVPLQELMKGLKTKQEGTTVVWRSHVSPATAERLLQSLIK